MVTLAGELDISNVGALYEELADLTREGVRHIEIDLATLEFMDSAGLSAIIVAHKRAEVLGGQLTLCSPGREVSRLFDAADIGIYLNIEHAPR